MLRLVSTCVGQTRSYAKCRQGRLFCLSPVEELGRYVSRLFAIVGRVTRFRLSDPQWIRGRLEPERCAPTGRWQGHCGLQAAKIQLPSQRLENTCEEMPAASMTTLGVEHIGSHHPGRLAQSMERPLQRCYIRRFLPSNNSCRVARTPYRGL